MTPAHQHPSILERSTHAHQPSDSDCMLLVTQSKFAARDMKRGDSRVKGLRQESPLFRRRDHFLLCTPSCRAFPRAFCYRRSQDRPATQSAAPQALRRLTTAAPWCDPRRGGAAMQPAHPQRHPRSSLLFLFSQALLGACSETAPTAVTLASPDAGDAAPRGQ